MDRTAFINVFHGVSRIRVQHGVSALPRVLLRPGFSTVRRSKFFASASAQTSASATSSTRAGKEEPNAYSSTVNLPKTAFEQRANSTKREPQLQRYWEENRIYEQLSRENPGEPFILHDGPPFANGPIHCGHALNKILKDFINKHALMCGRRAVFIPGWDTHGLPIELKVLQSLKSKDRKSLSTLDLRKRARSFAEETVSAHVEGMKRFGVWGDWDSPYLTLQPTYEAAQIQVFGKMFEKGFIFRGKKPVHWSPSTRTALAEAELEYPDGHTSRSAYCAFSATSVPETAPKALRDAVASGDDILLSIWTTTPWTLPANRAVAVNTNLEYALVSNLHPGRPSASVVVAKDLIESVSSKLGTAESVQVKATFKGNDLIGIQYAHPLEQGLECRVVEGGDYITTEAGTGLVHTAPGHGQEDYQTGLREGLELVSPVDDAGKFTEEAASGRFTGLSVLSDGNAAVIDAMDAEGTLMLEETYNHKYPYDWRSKKPTIFRATEQWFVSIDGFRADVLDAIEDVQWFPSSGIKRIRGMVEGRGDWCISRQRSWGVPIPVFYDDKTGEANMSPEIVSHVAELVSREGTDVWWQLEADDLLPESYRGRGLRKGTDTMDVWFDSGSSWAAVARARDGLQYPADMYLEGSDQHRGWFQSSMLTSVATEGKSPYKRVLTHGFVLDEKGVKMSKSIGNVIDPLQVINGGNNKKTEPPYGSDVLRLWVCSVDYTADSMIGPSILRQVSDVYKKLRNTVRYMVGNIHDFDPASHGVSYDKLPSLDRYMLSRLMKLSDEVDRAYDTYSFFKLYQAMLKFAVVDLSNFYLDIAKDRLYIPELDAFRRRSCQTVLAIILENYARMFAPIIPHTAEDLWQNLPYRPKSTNASFDGKSIFQAGWLMRQEEWTIVDDDVVNTWEVVLDVRDAVNKVLQAARVAKTVGAPMEADVKVFAVNDVDRRALQSLSGCPHDVDGLERALIVSKAEVVASKEDVARCAHHNLDAAEDCERFIVGLDKCSEDKCERCWHYDETVGTDERHPLLCDRCVSAVLSLGMASAPTQGAAAVV